MPLSGNQASWPASYKKDGWYQITASYSGDAVNSYSKVGLGEYVGKLPVSTRTKVSSSQAHSVYGQAVTFSSKITWGEGSGIIPDGETITFLDDNHQIGTATTAGGVATFTTSALTVGKHTIFAKYPGDPSLKPSQGSVKQIVSQ